MRQNGFNIKLTRNTTSTGGRLQRFFSMLAVLALGIGGGILGSGFTTGAASSTGTCLPITKGGTGVCTLAEAQTILGIKNPLDSYPIGAIYTSTTNTNPGTFLGGTWTQFGQGRTLLGVGSNAANNNTTFGNAAAGAINRTTVEETGGEVSHALVTAEMPSHAHTQNAHSHTMAGNGGFAVGGNLSSQTGWTHVVMGPGTQFGFSYNTTAGTNTTTATNQNTGGGGAHNNIQPYITVYFWKRTN
ncbi:hypothetical protein FWG95_03840 [Candidatus Saccharibacteria bacterium]|nr:hypothetical protein [Candidatus Saccharibacteria bacterium]